MPVLTCPRLPRPLEEVVVITEFRAWNGRGPQSQLVLHDVDPAGLEPHAVVLLFTATRKKGTIIVMK